MELYQVEQLHVEQKALLEATRKYLQGVAQEQEIHTVEGEIFRMTQRLGLVFMKEFLAQAGTGQVAGSCQTPAGQSLPLQDVKSCQYLSVFGRLEIPRAYYWEEGAAGYYPLDARLNLPERRYSYLLDQWAQAGIVEQAYDKATGALSGLLGIPIWKRGQEVVAREVAGAVNAFYQEQAVTEDEGPFLCAQADGKGVRMVPAEQPEATEAPEPARRGKGEKPGHRREALVTALYSFTPESRSPEELVARLMRELDPEARKAARKADRVREPRNKEVRACLYGKERAYELLLDRIAWRDPAGKKPIFMLLDGCSGLEARFLEAIQGRGWEARVVGIGLDIIHVMEYVWEAGTALHGEKGRGRVPWVRKTALSLLEGRVGRVIGALRQTLTKRGTDLKAAQKRALEKVIRYFENHRHLMRYDEWLERGFPIATGVVEGACGALVKDRTDASGMRWTRAGAQAVLDLRAVKKNGHWNEFWNYHVSQERRRLYGKVSA